MDNRMTLTFVMHHSDRGSQYCSSVFDALQARYDMQTFMSRKGNC